MKVLVTGGTGFLGANVVRHLLARGDEVRCLVRRTSPDLCLDGLPVERAQASLGDPEALRRALDGVEGVYHVAGIYDPGPGGEDAMRAVHVDGTRNLLDAAAAVGVRRVVLCSSSITVGFGPKDLPGDERTPLDADVYGTRGPLRTYHDTKAASERMAVDRTDVDVVIVNPDYVLGAWDVKPTSGALIVAIGKRWIPVYPRGGKCFVDADDAAQAHLLAFDRGVRGRRYLLGVHNRSYREFMSAIGAVVGRRAPPIPLPRRLTRPLAPFERARLLLAMQQDRYRSGRRAIEELGMPTTPLEISIEKAWRWFVDHGYLA